MAIHWYAHHLGDYAKHTKELTILEHGCYRLLLDFYYTKEGPIPNDLNLIYRACSAHTPTERRAIQKVLSKYFTRGEGVWCHPRADEEIKKRYEVSDIAREKAKTRWKVNMPQHMQGQCKPKAYNLKPTTNNQKDYRNGKSFSEEAQDIADRHRGHEERKLDG